MFYLRKKTLFLHLCVPSVLGLDRVQVGKSLLFSVLSWLPTAVARETPLFRGHMIWSCFLSVAGYKFANQRALGNLGRQSAYCPSQKMGQRSNSQSPSSRETTAGSILLKTNVQGKQAGIASQGEMSIHCLNDRHTVASKTLFHNRPLPHSP